MWPISRFWWLRIPMMDRSDRSWDIHNWSNFPSNVIFSIHVMLYFQYHLQMFEHAKCLEKTSVSLVEIRLFTRSRDSSTGYCFHSSILVNTLLLLRTSIPVFTNYILSFFGWIPFLSAQIPRYFQLIRLHQVSLSYMADPRYEDWEGWVPGLIVESCWKISPIKWWWLGIIYCWAHHT